MKPLFNFAHGNLRQRVPMTPPTIVREASTSHFNVGRRVQGPPFFSDQHRTLVRAGTAVQCATSLQCRGDLFANSIAISYKSMR